jgi:hypothetical protein
LAACAPAVHIGPTTPMSEGLAVKMPAASVALRGSVHSSSRLEISMGWPCSAPPKSSAASAAACARSSPIVCWSPLSAIDSPIVTGSPAGMRIGTIVSAVGVLVGCDEPPLPSQAAKRANASTAQSARMRRMVLRGQRSARSQRIIG